MTTAEVLERLRCRHPLPEWVSWRECWRIDFLAMRCWSSGPGHLRVAYEVKVSRSDFLRDRRHPWKHDLALELSHRFYYACPAGLVRPDEVPEQAGLLYVHPRLRARVAKPAPVREEVRSFMDAEVAYLSRFPLYRERIEEDRRELARLRAENRALRREAGGVRVGDVQRTLFADRGSVV